MDHPSEKPAPPALRCLRGGPPPPQIMADLDIVKTLPEPARVQLYRVLGPCLPEPAPDVQAQLDSFCREFGVRGPDLTRAVKACRFLLRQAAMTNLSAGDFGEDLAALGDTGAIAECLLSGYDTAVSVVRVEIAAGVIGDHGKLVERVSWRVDQIDQSDRGDKVGLSVVVLTLGYVESGRRDRVTLQIGADALRDLRTMCDRLVR